MKGWEIYQKDWGCGDWTRADNSWDVCDQHKHNRVFQWYLCPMPFFGFWFYTPGQCPIPACIRQPTPVQVLADERRLRCQIKLVQDQWRRALYDPSRAVCKKRIEAEFRDLSEEKDRIGCTDSISRTL